MMGWKAGSGGSLKVILKVASHRDHPSFPHPGLGSLSYPESFFKSFLKLSSTFEAHGLKSNENAWESALKIVKHHINNYSTQKATFMESV